MAPAPVFVQIQGNLASGLRGMGLEITLGQKSNKGREVTVTKLSNGAPQAPATKKPKAGAAKKKAKGK